MTIDQKIYIVLKEANSALILLQNNYFIIGASALILSGIRIENTNDIDLLVTNKDADFLKTIWKERLLENHITQNDDIFRSNFSRYHFDELDIEVMGNLEVKKNGIWIPMVIQDYLSVNINGICTKVPTIKEQQRILNLFGRQKDMERLKLVDEWKGIISEVIPK